jgi:hypothetical protein
MLRRSEAPLGLRAMLRNPAVLEVAELVTSNECGCRSYLSRVHRGHRARWPALMTMISIKNSLSIQSCEGLDYLH